MNRMSGETALGLAWIIALVASLAVLFIGEVLGQTPCVLCWFQRAFMFPLAIILGLGLWWRDGRVGRYGIALALGGGAELTQQVVGGRGVRGQDRAVALDAATQPGRVGA